MSQILIFMETIEIKYKFYILRTIFQFMYTGFLAQEVFLRFKLNKKVRFDPCQILKNNGDILVFVLFLVKLEFSL